MKFVVLLTRSLRCFVGTMSILWNPMPVHRIDKATSGLLVVAKTKPAMVHLSKQFRDRKVKKTCKYMMLLVFATC